MIEIKINNRTLALPVDFLLNQEVESKIFTKSDDAYDFTYPVDLPLTAENRLALGFPDVLANAFVNKEYAGTLTIDGVYTASVKIVVLSVSLQTQTCRVSLLGQYASLRDVFNTKKVNDLVMSGMEIIESFDSGFDDIEYSFTDCHIEDGSYDYGYLKLKYIGGPVNAFMRRVAKGLMVRDYLFPKAVDISPDLPGSPGGRAIINAWDHKRDRYVDADLYNAVATEWQYMPDITPASPHEHTDRHFWVPMYKVVRVLQNCFTESGLTVSGTIFTDPKFQTMVLYNTHAINWGVTGGWESPLTPAKHYLLIAGFSKGYIFPRNHLPDMEITEFISEMCKRFNWQIFYDPINKTVRINEDRSLKATPASVINLTGKVNPRPTINYERSDAFLNGLNFSFDRDGDDAAQGEDIVDDFEGYRYRGAVAKESLLNSVTFPSPLDKDYAYVRNINSYYEYKDGAGWVLFSHGIMPYKSTTKDNLQEITTKIVSNPMQKFPVQMIDFIPGYGRVFTLIGTNYENYSEPVPFSSIGITTDVYNYIDWDDTNGSYYSPGIGHPWDQHRFQVNIRPKKFYPHLVNCIGFQNGEDSIEQYYMATSAPYNANGVYLDVYSCSPGNPDSHSLYTEWWAGLLSLVENSFTVEYTVLMDAVTYASLKVNGSLIIIDNLLYFIKKANFIMPFPSLCTLSLVRL